MAIGSPCEQGWSVSRTDQVWIKPHLIKMGLSILLAQERDIMLAHYHRQ